MDRFKIYFFISGWILAILFMQAEKISCTVSDVSISGDAKANEGSSVTLTCSAACSNGSCLFTWSPVTSPSGAGRASDSTYTFTSIYRNDSTIYTCSVADVDGTGSASHTLQVNYGPDVVTFSPSATAHSIEEGSNYAVQCSCGQCEPSCSVTWTLDNVEVVGAQLNFSDTARHAAGDYICTCVNSVTSKRATATFSLTVLYPPVVTLSWNVQEKRLTCLAAGVPATYTFSKWKHMVGFTAIREIQGVGAVDGTSNSLTLSGSKPYMDTGVYRCGASNGVLGKADSKIQTAEQAIEITDIPLIVSSQENYNVSKGDALIIIIQAYARPKVESSGVTVVHSNSSIDITSYSVQIKDVLMQVPFYGVSPNVSGTQIKILISVVEEDYFGELLITLTNSEGNRTTEVTLTPQGPPDQPTNISFTEDVTSIKFTLKPGFFNGANQTFFVEYSTAREGPEWNNNTRIDAGSRKAPDYFVHVTIHGLQPETKYYFRFKGVNIYGESNTTEVIEVVTLEEPLNIGALVGGVAAGVVIVVVVIVIVVCVVKRRTGNAERTKSLQHVPLSNIISNNDQAPIIARSAYSSEVNVAGVTSSVIYENTPVIQHSRSNATGNGQEHVYSNTILSSVDQQQSVYQNFNASIRTKPGGSSSNLNSQSNQKIDEQDMNYTNESNSVADHFSANEAQTEEPYLEMEVKAAAVDYLNVNGTKTCETETNTVTPGEETYLEMEMTSHPPHTKDYLNVGGYKKSIKETGIKLKKPSISAEEKHRRESIPDYIAPPPPLADEEDYMNLHMGRKS